MCAPQEPRTRSGFATLAEGLMAPIQIERLDDASWLIANCVAPIGRSVIGDRMTWRFADSAETRRLLELFRQRDGGVRLLLAYSRTRDEERRTLTMMRAGQRRGGAR